MLGANAIKRYVRAADIVVDPLPDNDQYQPASLDVRLGEEIYNVHSDSYSERQSHEIDPHSLYIGHTTERIELPDNIGAFLTGRSSYGRKGLFVHVTAGWIDPGFSGQIDFELYNVLNEPISIETGDRIAQLLFFRVDGGYKYDGKYQNQEGVLEGQIDV